MAKNYNYDRKTNRRLPKRVWFVLAALAVIFVVATIAVRRVYDVSLGPVSNDSRTQLFTVETGSSVKQIAGSLEQKHLIRSAWAMELYVHSKELATKFQAGTYAIAPNQSTPAIVTIMTKGKVSTRLVTILPGRRIDQVRADLINAGFKPEDVDKALDPSLYSDMPVLSYKPASVNTLEGLLWPDSFQKDDATTPETIIRESLKEMGTHLTPDVQAAFANEGLTTYQGLVLTSIVTQEVNKPADQPQVAQVFLSRLKANMPLGSDVTARYGAVIVGHNPNDLTFESPYNTHLHPGLPPTPISTVTANALSASTHPAATDWLYFVTGDDGTTYFSRTLQDHQALTQKYCRKNC